MHFQLGMCMCVCRTHTRYVYVCVYLYAREQIELATPKKMQFFEIDAKPNQIKNAPIKWIKMEMSYEKRCG